MAAYEPRNMSFTRKGKFLNIKIDTSVTGEKSKSGKSNVLSTTSGPVNLKGVHENLDGVMLNLNMYVKA